MIVSVNQDLCEACGICSHVCPRHIPETIEKENRKSTTISLERIDLCLQCGHCVAVCPNHAIQIESLNEEEFVSVKALDISENEFLSFLQQRRSVRRYKDKALPREIINRTICNKVSKIRNLLGLSDDREVHASITLDYSKYEFRRVIPRRLAEVRYLE